MSIGDIQANDAGNHDWHLPGTSADGDFQDQVTASARDASGRPIPIITDIHPFEIRKEANAGQDVLTDLVNGWHRVGFDFQTALQSHDLGRCNALADSAGLDAKRTEDLKYYASVTIADDRLRQAGLPGYDTIKPLQLSNAFAANVINDQEYRDLTKFAYSPGASTS